MPVRYIHRTVARARLPGLYRASRVALVTPLRDGMNLVAKEFVASRVDEDGVLVLSEFAGAADEMPEALLVNPYDLDRVAEAFQDALLMSPDERRARMRSMRRRVMHHDAPHWARSFLAALEETEAAQPVTHERRTRTHLDAAVRKLVVRAAATASRAAAGTSQLTTALATPRRTARQTTSISSSVTSSSLAWPHMVMPTESPTETTSTPARSTMRAIGKS
jgi:trehalose-6-phosphate synthase